MLRISTPCKVNAVTAVSQSGNGYWAGPQRANVSRDPNLPVGGRSILQWSIQPLSPRPSLTPSATKESVSSARLARSILFNAFNHTNLDPPCLIFGPSFGLINASGPARQIQLGVRLIW